jgi:hypothetical protein
VFGGNNLEASNQNYIYFLVAPGGQFLIKHRARDSASRQDDREAIHTVMEATNHDAIRVPSAGSPSVNDLEVRVGASEIQYVVNGTVVHTTPKSGMTARTDGIYGVRINHVLPSTVVTNLRMTPGR